MASGGPNELLVGPPVDFDIADSILKVLEAWELGNRGLYRNYWAYKKIMKISKFYFGPGSLFTIFPDFFYEKWAGNTGITSETAITESRVRRRKPGIRFLNVILIQANSGQFK